MRRCSRCKIKNPKLPRVMRITYTAPAGFSDDDVPVLPQEVDLTGTLMYLCSRCMIRGGRQELIDTMRERMKIPKYYTVVNVELTSA